MDTRLAATALSLVLLAGCAGSASVTLEQEGLAAASGKDRKTLDCPDGKGTVEYDVHGTAGEVKIQVDDAVDEGPRPLDKDEVRGTATGSAEVQGDAGTWTLTVDRSGFSGAYRVTLSC